MGLLVHRAASRHLSATVRATDGSTPPPGWPGRLLITADAGGGSNGYRARAWKAGLAARGLDRGRHSTCRAFLAEDLTGLAEGLVVDDGGARPGRSRSTPWRRDTSPPR
jgi:hypothetical protein